MSRRNVWKDNGQEVSKNNLIYQIINAKSQSIPSRISIK